MDALIINLKNKIEKLITTISTPLSLITTERMNKIDTIDSNVDAKVSTRASQASLTNVSAKVAGLVEKTVGRIVTLGFGGISQVFDQVSDSLLILGQSRVISIRHHDEATASGSMSFELIVDGNLLVKGSYSTIVATVNEMVNRLGIVANESFEIVCTHNNYRKEVTFSVQYVLENQ